MSGKQRGDTPPLPRTPSIECAPGAHSHPLHPQELEETAPLTPSPHLLSPEHQRFAQEYIVDLNGTKAYQRAYPGVSIDSAHSNAHRLMANEGIRHEIQRLLDERATVTGVTADRVLLKLWDMATADPRELCEVRIGCCRHCWGMYHQYQYTEAELERAEHDHIQAESKRRKAEKEDFVAKPFHAKGGGGFDRNRQPNADCPECGGDGEARHIIKDTRNLSAGAARLFGGIKIDKQGNVTVVLRDPTVALLKVGEHLGLWSGKLPGPQNADPMTALLEEIRGRTGTGGALPVVQDDPERRAIAAPADIEDVEAKPKTPAATSAKKPGAWKAA